MEIDGELFNESIVALAGIAANGKHGRRMVSLQFLEAPLGDGIGLESAPLPGEDEGDALLVAVSIYDLDL